MKTKKLLLLTCIVLAISVLALSCVGAQGAAQAYTKTGSGNIVISTGYNECALGKTGSTNFNVNAGSNIGAFQFTILYDEEYIRVLRVYTEIEGADFMANTRVSGSIAVVGNLSANITAKETLFTVEYELISPTNAPLENGDEIKDSWALNESATTSFQTMRESRPYDLTGISYSFSDIRVGLYGDVDGDGVVNTRDLAYAQMDMLGIQALSAQGKANIDIDGDGTISLKESQSLKMFTADLIDSVSEALTPTSSGGDSGSTGVDTSTKFNVIFSSATGAIYKTVSVKAGSYVLDFPEVDVEDNSEFVGWYYVVDGSRKYFEEDTPVTSNLIVFAEIAYDTEAEGSIFGSYIDSTTGDSFVLNSDMTIVFAGDYGSSISYNIKLDGNRAYIIDDLGEETPFYLELDFENGTFTIVEIGAESETYTVNFYGYKKELLEGPITKKLGEIVGTFPTDLELPDGYYLQYWYCTLNNSLMIVDETTVVINNLDIYPQVSKNITIVDGNEYLGDYSYTDDAQDFTTYYHLSLYENQFASFVMSFELPTSSVTENYMEMFDGTKLYLYKDGTCSTDYKPELEGGLMVATTYAYYSAYSYAVIEVEEAIVRVTMGYDSYFSIAGNQVTLSAIPSVVFTLGEDETGRTLSIGSSNVSDPTSVDDLSYVYFEGFYSMMDGDNLYADLYIVSDHFDFTYTMRDDEVETQGYFAGYFDVDAKNQELILSIVYSSESKLRIADNVQYYYENARLGVDFVPYTIGSNGSLSITIDGYEVVREKEPLLTVDVEVGETTERYQVENGTSVGAIVNTISIPESQVLLYWIMVHQDGGSNYSYLNDTIYGDCTLRAVCMSTEDASDSWISATYSEVNYLGQSRDVKLSLDGILALGSTNEAEVDGAMIDEETGIIYYTKEAEIAGDMISISSISSIYGTWKDVKGDISLTISAEGATCKEGDEVQWSNVKVELQDGRVAFFVSDDSVYYIDVYSLGVTSADSLYLDINGSYYFKDGIIPEISTEQVAYGYLYTDKTFDIEVLSPDESKTLATLANGGISNKVVFELNTYGEKDEHHNVTLCYVDGVWLTDESYEYNYVIETVERDEENITLAYLLGINYALQLNEDLTEVVAVVEAYPQQSGNGGGGSDIANLDQLQGTWIYDDGQGYSITASIRGETLAYTVESNVDSVTYYGTAVQEFYCVKFTLSAVEGQTLPWDTSEVYTVEQYPNTQAIYLGGYTLWLDGTKPDEGGGSEPTTLTIDAFIGQWATYDDVYLLDIAYNDDDTVSFELTMNEVTQATGTLEIIDKVAKFLFEEYEDDKYALPYEVTAIESTNYVRFFQFAGDIVLNYVVVGVEFTEDDLIDIPWIATEETDTGVDSYSFIFSNSNGLNTFEFTSTVSDVTTTASGSFTLVDMTLTLTFSDTTASCSIYLSSTADYASIGYNGLTYWRGGNEEPTGGDPSTGNEFTVEDLIGSWQTADDSAEFVFVANNTFTYTSNATTTSGTFYFEDAGVTLTFADDSGYGIDVYQLFDGEYAYFYYIDVQYWLNGKEYVAPISTIADFEGVWNGYTDEILTIDSTEGTFTLLTYDVEDASIAYNFSGTVKVGQDGRADFTITAGTDGVDYPFETETSSVISTNSEGLSSFELSSFSFTQADESTPATT